MTGIWKLFCCCKYDGKYDVLRSFWQEYQRSKCRWNLDHFFLLYVVSFPPQTLDTTNWFHPNLRNIQPSFFSSGHVRFTTMIFLPRFTHSSSHWIILQKESFLAWSADPFWYFTYRLLFFRRTGKQRQLEVIFCQSSRGQGRTRPSTETHNSLSLRASTASTEPFAGRLAAAWKFFPSLNPVWFSELCERLRCLEFWRNVFFQNDKLLEQCWFVCVPWTIKVNILHKKNCWKVRAFAHHHGHSFSIIAREHKQLETLKTIFSFFFHDVSMKFLSRSKYEFIY